MIIEPQRRGKDLGTLQMVVAPLGPGLRPVILGDSGIAGVVERLDTPVARSQSARRAGLALAAVRPVTARTVMVRRRRLRGDRTGG